MNERAPGPPPMRRAEDFADIPPFLVNKSRYFKSTLARLQENNRRLEKKLAMLDGCLMKQCAQTELALDTLDGIIGKLEL